MDNLLKMSKQLENFLQRFDKSIKTKPSRKHLRTYVSGQLSDLERKSIEPIALEYGTPPRTLQEFLSIHRWDEDQLSQCVRQVVVEDHYDELSIGIIDETGFPKKGKETIGVSRQWCGQTGKLDNCVVNVDLGYVSEDFHCLIDNDLFIPENYFEDPERLKAKGVPTEISFRTKPEIAIELIKRSLGDGVPLQWILADELYGRSQKFRESLGDLNLSYVVEVPCSTMGRIKSSKVGFHRVDELWEVGGVDWETFYIKETQKGPEVWDARAVRFEEYQEGAHAKFQWLIMTQSQLSGQIKYFMSNAPEHVEAEVLLKVAFNRWHIERIFQDAKGEIGFGHFEVRGYKSLKRHMILSMVSFLFLAKMRDVFSDAEKNFYSSGETNCGNSDKKGRPKIRAA